MYKHMFLLKLGSINMTQISPFPKLPHRDYLNEYINNFHMMQISIKRDSYNYGHIFANFHILIRAVIRVQH